MMINFYDNYTPSLKDGQYKITLSQNLVQVLSIDPSEPYQSIPGEVQSPALQSFILKGPRFTIPPSDINHVFPADGSTGVFDTYMPQIVLNEKSLPWERNLDLGDVKIPWMALLVFSDDELPIPPPVPSKGSQQNPTHSTSRLLNDLISPGTGILGPSIKPEADEDPTQLYCDTIDIPVAAFNALMPAIEDARMLAHTRQVSLINKAPAKGKSGFFSAVIANRFAVPPTGLATKNKNIVHLVSLEGFEKILPTVGPPNISGYNMVRMVSLYSWSFHVQAEPAEDFSKMMNNLISAASIQATGLLLRMPLPNPPVASNDPVTTKALNDRLQNGYTPLGYKMQSGDQSFGWYRGPCSPVPVLHFLAENNNIGGNPLTPYRSSDAMIFDPTTGIFDQSYAVAFQTGRSLALANQSFAASITHWRKNAYGMVDLILEYMTSPVYASKMIADGLMDAQGKLTDTGVTDLAAIIDIDLVPGAFTDFMTTDFYRSLASSIGQPGGFTSSDDAIIVQEAPNISPGGPADLLHLMQEASIVNLLQHVSGLDTLGTLASPLQQNDTSLTLNAAGISEAISSGTDLVIYSPDGKTSVWLTIAEDAALNATTLAIIKYTGTSGLPANSSIQVRDADPDALTVVNFLSATALLSGVPFNNLVPNPAMLPPESFRFFYIDRNWTDSLLAGAMSIGVQSSRDALFNQLMRDSLYKKVEVVMAELRDALLGTAADGHSPGILKPTGFLLRSRSITNYPGLEITATTASGTSMKPLRLERLSVDLLIGIYPDVPTSIIFSQPSEGMVFGLEELGGEKEIFLRYIPGVAGFTSSNSGTKIGGDEHPQTLSLSALQQANRAGAFPAMNIAGTEGLATILQNTLACSNALTPATFAVEMVCVPEQMILKPLILNV